MFKLYWIVPLRNKDACLGKNSFEMSSFSESQTWCSVFCTKTLAFCEISVEKHKTIAKSFSESYSKWKGHFQPARLLWPQKYLSNFSRPKSLMIFYHPIRTCVPFSKSLQDIFPNFIQSLRYTVWTLFFYMCINVNSSAFQNIEKAQFLPLISFNSENVKVRTESKSYLVLRN